MAAILDAILKIIAFSMWDSGELLVWYLKYYPNPLKNLLYNEF